MAAKNEHTGDTLVSKPNTKAYEQNYEAIFCKPKEEVKQQEPVKAIILDLT